MVNMFAMYLPPVRVVFSLLSVFSRTPKINFNKMFWGLLPYASLSTQKKLTWEKGTGKYKGPGYMLRKQNEKVEPVQTHILINYPASRHIKHKLWHVPWDTWLAFTLSHGHLCKAAGSWRERGTPSAFTDAALFQLWFLPLWISALKRPPEPV